MLDAYDDSDAAAYTTGARLPVSVSAGVVVAAGVRLPLGNLNFGCQLSFDVIIFKMLIRVIAGEGRAVLLYYREDIPAFLLHFHLLLQKCAKTDSFAAARQKVRCFRWMRLIPLFRRSDAEAVLRVPEC